MEGCWTTRPSSGRYKTVWWDLKGGIPSPIIDTGPAAPSGLIYVISCCCKAEGKACSTQYCNYRRNNISCTIHCVCTTGYIYCNPLTMTEDMNHNGEDHQLEDVSEEEEYECMPGYAWWHDLHQWYYISMFVLTFLHNICSWLISSRILAVFIWSPSELILTSWFFRQWFVMKYRIT